MIYLFMEGDYISLSYNTDHYLAILPLLITNLPKDILHTITGNLLGDGYLQVQSHVKGVRKGNALFNIHFLYK